MPTNCPLFRDDPRSYRVGHVYLSCKMFELTLREVELFMRIFNITLGHERLIARWIYMDCYSFFICLYIKQKELFKQILTDNFSIDSFLDFIKKIALPDDPYHPSKYLLKEVACSLLKEQTLTEGNKNKINETFPHRDLNAFLSLGEGFELSQIQPAISICEKINQCKNFNS